MPGTLQALTRGQVYGVCLVMFIEGLSSSSINVQVAAVRADLAPGPVGLQLVASTFLVAYAALLLPAGRLADWLDRRRVFLVGLGLFAAGSLLGALAPSVWVLVLARLLQGSGAALTAPAALGLITAPLAEGAARNRMVALYGALGAVGFSTGLVLPGFLVAHLGWRSSFAVLLPFVALVLVLTWRVPSAPGTRSGDGATGRPDWWGTAAVLGLIGGGTWLLGAVRGLSMTALVTALLVLACCAGVVLARRRLTLPDALLVAPVARATLTIGAGSAGMLASIYVLTLALQDWHGMDAFTVGLLILPQPAFFALFARAGSAWVSRSGTTAPMMAGMALITTGTAALSLAGPAAPPELVVPLCMGVVGTGLALLFPAASICAVNGTPERIRSSTAAALTCSQNIGGSAGIALVTALALVPEPGAPRHLVAPMVLCAVMIASGLGAALLTLRVRRPGLTRPSGPVGVGP